ncbi:MAG: hypothetical protein WD847_18215 [Pirellulales bacterium]
MQKRLVLALVAVALLSLAAYAQKIDYSAGRKMSGSVYRPHSASAYQRQARSHARVLNHYGRRHEAVPQDTAQEHATEIRRNMEAATKEVAKLEKDKQLRNNKQIMEQVAKVREHHAKAAEMCDMLDEACAQGDADSATLCECCSVIYKELEAAEAEHDKLKQMLGVEPLDEPGKEPPAKKL